MSGVAAGPGRVRATAGVACVLVLASASPAVAQRLPLVPFEMKDQFDRVHRNTDYADQILILLGSDRKGSAFHDD